MPKVPFALWKSLRSCPKGGCKASAWCAQGLVLCQTDLELAHGGRVSVLLAPRAPEYFRGLGAPWRRVLKLDSSTPAFSVITAVYIKYRLSRIPKPCPRLQSAHLKIWGLRDVFSRPYFQILS